jgi:hypothetical protein
VETVEAMKEKSTVKLATFSLKNFVRVSPDSTTSSGPGFRGIESWLAFLSPGKAIHVGVLGARWTQGVGQGDSDRDWQHLGICFGVFGELDGERLRLGGP